MNEKNKIKKKEKEITRKEALKKLGTYAAYTALGTIVLLSPKAAQATSPPTAPGW